MTSRPSVVLLAAAGLLLVLFLHLTLTVSRNSAAFDEPAHIYAGYLQWVHGHYTLNPPVTRYLLAAPLLGLDLQEPETVPRSIRAHEILGGREFVFSNDAQTLLFRSRMAIVALAVILALLVFLATRQMFGPGAGLIALGLLAFDPTFVAHSSLATTDTGQALFLFGAVLAFYRYVDKPTPGRLLVAALAVGLAIAAKASAVQLYPILALLALVELAWRRQTDSGAKGESIRRRALRLTGALAVIGIGSLLVLWASYGFRYVPADGGVPLIPDMEQKLAQVPSALAANVLEVADRLHLLPRAFTYGLAHTLYEARAFSTYVLGTTYPHPVWFFFPISMLIKSSLAFLILVAISIWAIARGRVDNRRALVYLVLPAAVYLLIAITGGMNIGVRHVLPVYVFLSAAIGGAVWALARENRRWLWATVGLLTFQAVSVLHAFPATIAYANEAFGGPGNVHRLLSDSNVDWGQQLNAVREYLEENEVEDCWFASFGQGTVDYRDYGIRCKPLTTVVAMYFALPSDKPPDVPPVIDGTVLISACTLSGFQFGPPPLHPYEQFEDLEPVAVLDSGVFVYQGRFEVPLAAALSHVQKARGHLWAGESAAALVEARRAADLAPESAMALATLGEALEAVGEGDEAGEVFSEALALARRDAPEFQVGLAADLERRLATAKGSPTEG